MDRVARVLRAALLLIFTSLFAVSFWESWARLADAARQAKVPHPGPWPWAVDGFVLVLVLLVILGALEGRKPKLPRFGIVAMTALSAAVSVLYTPDDAVGRWHAAYFVSAWPPIGAWLSFEGLMWLIFGKRAATSANAGEGAAQDAAEVRQDRRTEDAPEAAPVAASERDHDAAQTAAAWVEPARPDDRIEAASEHGQDAAKTPPPARPPTAAEVRKIDAAVTRIEGRGERVSGRKVAASANVPEKVVRAYLATRVAPSVTVAAGNGAGRPPVAE